MKAIVRCRVDAEGNIEIEISANALKTINKAAMILNVIATVGGERCKPCEEAAKKIVEAIEKINAEGCDDEQEDGENADQDAENQEQ